MVEDKAATTPWLGDIWVRKRADSKKTACVSAQADVILYVEKHLPMVFLVGSVAWGDAEGPEASALQWLGLEESLPPEEGLLRGPTGPVPKPPATGRFTNPPQGFLAGPRDILYTLHVSLSG